MDILETLVFRDTVAEALAMMTPEELLIAAARVAGLGDEEMAVLLNVEPATVAYHLAQAKKRIMAEMPELRVLLSDRSMPWGARQARRPEQEPERDPDAGATKGVGAAEAQMYCLVDAAALLGVDEGTLALWLQERMFPGACRVGKEWWIPAEDLASGVGGRLADKATTWSRG